LEAAGAAAKIGLSLTSNHHEEIWDRNIRSL